MYQITVCFTPVQFSAYPHEGANAVAIDILRASTSICTAFMNGAHRVIPLSSVDELKAYAGKAVIAAERDGVKLDFADIGNSPKYFTRETIEGKTIAYSTTNGTHTIRLAAQCHQAAVGSYLNFSALCRWLEAGTRNVFLLCAGWKGRFNLEDAVFAGAVAQKLIDSGKFESICDSAMAAMDLWSLAKGNLMGYIKKAAQNERLRKINAADTIPYCHTPDQTDIVPLYKNGALERYTPVHPFL
ncbi:MAG: 2-phosphosulfolactate phosphatase [Bacteroidales bacterium]|jgi:2-phosphosulfolactate phosphatase|nr:2-phosphosulfolactate phosphatase [Bacteroidales bacterium]